MRTASPGNRLVVGDSGIVFELPDQVASGCVGNKTVQYWEPPVAAPVARAVRRRRSGTDEVPETVETVEP